jgi:hypothetical protein
MSALPPKADMVQHDPDVRFVPKADIVRRHPVTLSVRASTEAGIFRPSILAVLVLMTNSYRAGNSTGRSAGLAPFSILSTYTAIRRNWTLKSSPYDISKPASACASQRKPTRLLGMSAVRPKADIGSAVAHEVRATFQHPFNLFRIDSSIESGEGSNLLPSRRTKIATARRMIVQRVDRLRSRIHDRAESGGLSGSVQHIECVLFWMFLRVGASDSER